MKKGFALITVLAVMLMIALGAATILQSIGSHTSMKSNNLQDVKSQYLAEAGMQYALWQCRQSTGCTGNPATIDIDGTTVDIGVTRIPPGLTPPSNKFVIQVTVNYTDV